MQYMCNMYCELFVHIVFYNNLCKFRTLIKTLIVSRQVEKKQHPLLKW